MLREHKKLSFASLKESSQTHMSLYLCLSTNGLTKLFGNIINSLISLPLSLYNKENILRVHCAQKSNFFFPSGSFSGGIRLRTYGLIKLKLEGLKLHYFHYHSRPFHYNKENLLHAYRKVTFALLKSNKFFRKKEKDFILIHQCTFIRLCTNGLIKLKWKD